MSSVYRVLPRARGTVGYNFDDLPGFFSEAKKYTLLFYKEMIEKDSLDFSSFISYELKLRQSSSPCHASRGE